MNTNNEDKVSEKEINLLDKLIDMDKIEREGATLKVVAENMRTLLACIAMFVGVAALYFHNPNGWEFKCFAIFWGLWIAIYTLLAAIQTAFILTFALRDIVETVLHPKFYKQYFDVIALILVVISMLIMLGTLSLVAATTLRAFSK